MAEPKILYWDIETSLQLAAIFSLANNDWIDPQNLVTERYIICASWQWEGESKVHSVSVLDNPELYAKDPHNDYHVCSVLHAIMSEADVIVHHNGDSFDKRYLDTRLLVNGLPALPPVASIDTYKVAKSRLMLNSNKLDYIGKLLGVGRKIKTSHGLWLKVLNGDTQAIKQMVIYNKGDVTLLRNVFLKLRPYISSHVNRELFGGTGCPRCGSKKVQYRGYHRAISRVYRRLQCQSCQGWFREATNDRSFTAKSRVL